MRINVSPKVIPLGHTDVAFLNLISPNSRAPSEFVDRPSFPIARMLALSFPDPVNAAAIGPLALTPREREILELLAAGQTAKPIAAALSLALSTVRTHIQNLLRKLDVHSCLEAVTYYFRLRNGSP